MVTLGLVGVGGSSKVMKNHTSWLNGDLVTLKGFAARSFTLCRQAASYSTVILSNKHNPDFNLTLFQIRTPQSSVGRLDAH